MTTKTPRISGIGPRVRGAARDPGREELRAAAALAVRSAPQTRHLVAAAPTRVPQVGHSRGAVVEEAGDLFMGAGIIPSGTPQTAWQHKDRARASVSRQGAIQAQNGGDDPHGFNDGGD